MKPSRLIPVGQLPVTRHGKLDRAAIGAWPLGSALESALEASDNRPLTETEEKLVSIWAQRMSPEGDPGLGDAPLDRLFCP